MQEFPAIRFRAAKPTGDDPVLEARALAAQRVAVEINDRLLALQKAGIASTAGEAAASPAILGAAASANSLEDEVPC